MTQTQESVNLGPIDVLSPVQREVDGALTDIVGEVLRTYILEDELNDPQLNVIMGIGELLCLNIESVKLDIVEKGEFQQWAKHISATLNVHASNDIEAYSHIAYLRTDVTMSQPWALFMVVVICRHYEARAKEVGLEFEYTLRFCENVISSIFSGVEAQRT
jgi:hypothetical protein